jgi:hypothetical protein
MSNITPVTSSITPIVTPSVAAESTTSAITIDSTEDLRKKELEDVALSITVNKTNHEMLNLLKDLHRNCSDRDDKRRYYELKNKYRKRVQRENLHQEN